MMVVAGRSTKISAHDSRKFYAAAELRTEGLALKIVSRARNRKKALISP